MSDHNGVFVDVALSPGTNNANSLAAYNAISSDIKANRRGALAPLSTAKCG
ncbi:MAG: hypothetical protein M0T84_08665 [Betaproteobacteria bacterium]|nr:hypothetical protein [Betaproteobacteria bacterium]